MPWCWTRAAAVSSWVDSGLEAHSTTLAPPALRVRIRLAVSVVTCRQAATFRPSRGRSFSKRARMSRSTGMCRSAHSMRRRPSSARARSVTSYGKGPPPVGLMRKATGSGGGHRKQRQHQLPEAGPDEGRDLQHLGVAGRGAAGPVHVGDGRDGRHPQPVGAGGDHLGHGRHADRVGAPGAEHGDLGRGLVRGDRKSTRLNSSHTVISYAVFCLKKKKKKRTRTLRLKKKKKKKKTKK